MPNVVEEAKELIERPDVRLMSLMDHTPGQRQFRDEVKLREYYRGKSGGMTDAELDVLFERRLAYQKAYARDQYARHRGARARHEHSARQPRRHHARACRGRRSATAWRSPSFRPRSRRRAGCTRPASAC